MTETGKNLPAIVKSVIFIGDGGHFRSVPDVAVSSGQVEIAGVRDDTLNKHSAVNGVEVLGPTSAIGSNRDHYRELRIKD